VLDTSLIQHLLNCLLIDTSATVVDLALTILIMFLPHITTTLVSILPKLFLVYARVLCWDLYNNQKVNKQTDSDSENSSPISENGCFAFDPSWALLERSFDNVQSITPKANYLFTFLYGLFPLNFMNFVRKPRRYLKMKNYPNAEGLDLNQGMIRTRTEAHRSVHVLHPNFFTTTPDDELTDNKWLKADPADLVSECLGLCIAVSNTLSDPGPPPTSKLPEIPKVAKKLRPIPSAPATTTDDGAVSPTELRSNSWRNTLSTTPTTPSSNANYPVDPMRVPPRRSSRASLLDPTRSSKDNSRNTSPTAVEREDAQGGRPRSPPKKLSTPPRQSSPPLDKRFPRLQAFAQALAGSTITNPTSPDGQPHGTVVLQREIMLLKNDLNFERYLKQQHLAHIGQLQRKHINEATIESEAQNLYNTNRTLKAKLLRANELYAQLKKETQTSRSQSKKYEEQLSSKVKTYREEEKQWLTEMEALRHDFERLTQECERLRNLVVESEIREHHSKNSLVTMQRDLEEMGCLKKQIEEMEAKVQGLEMQELEHQRTQEDHDILRNELETVKMELASRDAEKERTKKTYDHKVAVLEARLRTAAATGGPNSQLPASVQQMIDSALAASNSKLQQLRRAHTMLLHKYTELELRAQNLEAGRPSRPLTSPHSSDVPRPGSVLSLTRFADDAAMFPEVPTSLPSSLSRSNSISRRQDLHSAGGSTRRPHAFTDPALFEEDRIIPEDSFLSSQAPMSSRALGLSFERSQMDREHARPARYESLQNLRSQPVRSASPNREHEERRQQQSKLGPAFEPEYTHDFHVRATEPLNITKSAPGSGSPAEPVPIRYGGRGMFSPCLRE
jgi:Hamartin protein